MVIRNRQVYVGSGQRRAGLVDPSEVRLGAVDREPCGQAAADVVRVLGEELLAQHDGVAQFRLPHVELSEQVLGAGVLGEIQLTDRSLGYARRSVMTSAYRRLGVRP